MTNAASSRERGFVSNGMCIRLSYGEPNAIGNGIGYEFSPFEKRAATKKEDKLRTALLTIANRFMRNARASCKVRHRPNFYVRPRLMPLAVIRVYNAAGNVIATNERAGDFVES